MSPWPFVIGAYAAAAFGMLGLLWHSLAAMRRAEAKAEAAKAET